MLFCKIKISCIFRLHLVLKVQQKIGSSQIIFSQSASIYVLPLYQWFSTDGSFAPRDVWQCLETFLSVTDGQGWDDTSIQWLEARDTAKHPTVHSTTSHNSYPAQKFDQCKVEKPCSVPSVSVIISLISILEVILSFHSIKCLQ